MDEVLQKLGVKLEATLYDNAPTGRALYRVRNQELGLRYSLKRLDMEKNTAKVIQREVVALNRTQFGLLPHCHARLQHSGSLYLLLDWVEGEPLAERFPEPPEDARALARRLDALIKAAREVNQLHRNRLLHRDLKPENIILRGDHQRIHSAHLIDLGLSAQDRETQEGTAHYRAPEQSARRDRSLSAEADVFSLGQIGWYLINAEPLVLDYNADYSGWAEPELPLMPAFIPSGLTTVLERATAFAGKSRYRGANDFANAIQREMKKL